MLLAIRYTLLVFCIILFINATTANGNIWTDNGGMHIEDEGQYTINQEISEWVHVDYFSKPNPGTRIDILEQGILRQGLKAYGNSQIYISGGTVQEEFSAWDNSQLIFNNGYVGWDLWCRDHSHGQVLNGVIGQNLVSSNFSNIEVYGGKIEGNFITYWYSTIKIYGTNFNYPLGKLPVTTGHLTGFLLDGTPLDNDFEILGSPNWYDAAIVLVPEPCTLTLLVIGGSTIMRKHKILKICKI